MGRISYVIPDDLHRRIKALAGRQGRTLKAWHERALTEVVERQEAEAADDDRKRRR